MLTMKHFYLLLFILSVYSVEVKSQNSKSINVQAGSSITDVLSFKQIYSYPDFVVGKVVFKDGAAYNAKLNYNLYVGQIQFINRAGDTLSLANENTLKYVSIEKDTFFYDKGYFRLLEGNPNVKLAVQQRIKVVDKQKIGAFGQPTSGAGVQTVDRIVQINRLTLMENTILSKETKYYLGNHFNQFIPFNKNNLLKRFLNHQNEIKAYLKETEVDFNKQEDLMKVIRFLQTFQN
jgi:hypothetical protein